MALSQDLTEMLAALRRARRDLDDSLSSLLSAEPPDARSLARLQELAERNAQKREAPPGDLAGAGPRRPAAGPLAG